MKVGVVGAGLVGATSAYAMAMRGVCTEITFVDKNTLRARAESEDILHATPFAHRARVKSGDYEDLAGSRVVVVAAGVGQRPGETRLQLLTRNAAVYADVIPNILKAAPDCILLIVTNPVDIMTHLAAGLASEFNVPPCRVIGSGTTLDTARFRALLGRHFGIDAQHVHGYVLGEHGDSEALTWSLVSIGPMGLDEFAQASGIKLDAEAKRAIDENVRRAAYKIIEGKGATYYGIGSAVAYIVEVILNDSRTILTLSARTPDVAGVKDVTVSLPRLLGGAGIISTFDPPLSSHERDLLHRSANVIKTATLELGGKYAGKLPVHVDCKECGGFCLPE